MAGDEDQKQDEDEDIWILVELKSLEDLATPIKLSKTIQFTTIDVSKSYIWCGSNRSSLYVFDRQTLKHVYLITISPVMPDVEAVTQLAVCHTDQLCAVSIGCQVFTSSIHSGTTKKPEVVEALRTDATVTQLVWHGSSAKLYIGDNAGSVHVCFILTNKMIPRSSLLCRLDSCIVQLDFKDHFLLAATLTKCTTYHTERKTFTDIGKKARNGYYGAVILPSVETENSSAPELVCYCSRPGLRLWRADTHGKVLATLNFKQTLAQSLLSPVFSSLIGRELSAPKDASNITQFSYLRHISERHILSTSGNKIVILDPSTSQVLVSTGIDDGLTGCCVHGNECYLVTANGDVRCLQLCTVGDYLKTLIHSEAVSEAIELTQYFKSWFLKHASALEQLEEMISPEHEQHKAFSEDFAEAIESYRSSTFIKSSRSSTMSSLSGQFMTDSQASSGSSASPMHVYQQLSQRVDNFKRSPQANADVAEGTQVVLVANREGCNYISPSETEKSSPSLSNQDSMRSLASLTSLRRGSCTSQSSIDQSGEHTEDLSPHRTVRRDRRVKSSSTFSLEGPVADRDSSSPIPVVDHVREVKDQVLDGFSKISTQAKTLISNIKGRTISQPVMERILSATTWDDASGEGSLECKDSWEDGDSRQAFFIGDEEIGFGDEMPTGLGPFLSLTDLRYSELTDPVNLLDENDEVEQLLTEWSERLCLVLSQYTRTASVSTPEGRTLRHLTRICPWRMNTRMAKKCEYLATLCVIHSGSEPILDYFIDRKSESIPPYLISDVVQVSQYTALEQGRKGKAIQSSLFGRSTNLENENTHAKISPSSASSVSSISGLVSTGECSANHNENTFEITEQIESNTELSMQGSQNGSTSPTNHGLPSPNTGISLASDIECNISFTAPSAESSVVLACQFMSVFWFLMNARELCSYVEHLCSANSTLRKQKAIWTALINCLIGGTHDKLEWKPVFTTSLFTSSDVSRGLLEQKDKPRLWLIVYLLMRQQQFDEAISIALASQLQVPPLHIMYCLRACAELDNLPLSTVHQLFSGYVLSLIQQQDSSSRPMFVKEMSQSGIVDFWMESLEGSWKSDSMYQSQCVCGQPNLLTADSLPSNLRALQHILEENMVHIPRVKSTILLIGGAMALVRLKKKEDDKEDLLKLLLLATDISLFQQLIAGFQMTKENCLYLLNQRASQQTTETERFSCLWCQKTYNRSEPLLTWDSVAEVILERLGPETCVDVLLESSIPKNSVSNNFFSKCVSVHEHDVQSSQLVNDAIDGLERFLWSTELTNNCCDSRLYQLILKEVELHKSVRDGHSIIDSEQDELVEMGHALQETSSLRTLEDAEVHWGTVVSVSDDCYHCGLCLSQANVAVTVFQCGHSVHHDCCQASHGCVQCQSKM